MREEHLRYVLEILQAGSINKAAENLYISHQSLNRSLKTFENELGAAIFKRTQKGVQLTKLGVQIIDKIEILVSTYDELREIVHHNQELAEKFDRTFIFNCSSYLRFPFVSKLMPKILESFPNVRLITKLCSTNISAINDGFHLILTWDDSLEKKINQKETMFWDIAETKMYLIVSNEHHLAKYQEISLAKALKYPFVLLQLGDKMMNPLLEWLQMKQLTATIALETDHIQSYVNALKNGKYVGIWLQSALEMDELKNDRTLKKIMINDLPSLHICGLMLKNNYENNQDIMQQLIKNIGKLI